jgi:hypothetical protein
MDGPSDGRRVGSMDGPSEGRRDGSMDGPSVSGSARLRFSQLNYLEEKKVKIVFE